MYTEKEIQEGIQTSILSIDNYEGGDVVINDWTIFDKPVALSPYTIIGNSPDPDIDYRMEERTYRFPIIVVVAFQKTWKDTEDALRDERQEIIDLFETDPYQQLGLDTANEGLEVQSIVMRTAFLPWYDPALSEDEMKDATPLFLFQEMTLNVRNY